MASLAGMQIHTGRVRGNEQFPHVRRLLRKLAKKKKKKNYRESSGGGGWELLNHAQTHRNETRTRSPTCSKIDLNQHSRCSTRHNHNPSGLPIQPKSIEKKISHLRLSTKVTRNVYMIPNTEKQKNMSTPPLPAPRAVPSAQIFCFLWRPPTPPADYACRNERPPLCTRGGGSHRRRRRGGGWRRLFRLRLRLRSRRRRRRRPDRPGDGVAQQHGDGHRPYPAGHLQDGPFHAAGEGRGVGGAGS